MSSGRRWMIGCAVAGLILLSVGCTSANSATGSIDASDSAGTAGPRRTIAVSADSSSGHRSTGAVAQGSAGVTLDTARPSANGIATPLTGASCKAAVARAIVAVARLMPDGTARAAVRHSMCNAEYLLYVDFPATRAQAWTVRIKVRPGTAADCPLNGGQSQCRPVNGSPGLIGTEMQCGGVPCDDGSVSGFGYHAEILCFLTDFDLRRPLVDTPGALGIGVSVLTAITG